MLFPILQFLLLHPQQAAGVRPGYAVQQSWTSSTSTAITEFLFSTDSALFPSSTSAKNACRRGLIYIDGKKAQVCDVANEGSVIEKIIRVEQGDFITNTQGNEGQKGTRFHHLQVVYEDNHCGRTSYSLCHSCLLSNNHTNTNTTLINILPSWYIL